MLSQKSILGTQLSHDTWSSTRRVNVLKHFSAHFPCTGTLAEFTILQIQQMTNDKPLPNHKIVRICKNPYASLSNMPNRIFYPCPCIFFKHVHQLTPAGFFSDRICPWQSSWPSEWRSSSKNWSGAAGNPTERNGKTAGKVWKTDIFPS